MTDKIYTFDRDGNLAEGVVLKETAKTYKLAKHNNKTISAFRHCTQISKNDPDVDETILVAYNNFRNKTLIEIKRLEEILEGRKAALEKAFECID